MPGSAVREDSRNILVACRVMEPELNHLLSMGDEAYRRTEIHYLEQALHRTPDRLLSRVQESMDQLAGPDMRIVLGYGLCARGIVGIRARSSELIIPRCHDCIALFLGSPARYLDLFRENPGTYYLTSGWLADHQDPLGLIEEHTPRYGREKALWIIEEELRHYTHIALIDTGVGGMASMRERAMENAAILKKGYREIQGSLTYFRELLVGPYPDEQFLRLGPGETFTPEMVF